MHTGVRSHLPRLILLIALLCSVSPALSEVTVCRLPLEEAWDLDTPSGRRLAEVISDPAVDRSLVPTLSWWWILAPGERISGVELQIDAETAVGTLEGTPRRLPLFSSRGEMATDPRGGEPLWSDNYEIDISPPRNLHGQVCQSIVIRPLRRGGDRLFALERGQLIIHTITAPTEQGVQPERFDFPVRERILRTLGHQLLNPNRLPEYLTRAVGGSGFPTEVPSVEGSAVDMVMVTVDSLMDICEEYAEQRTDLGVATVVRSVEWIEERYPFGSDRQELIRNFLIDAYTKWSIEYVLLVGDVDLVPVRYASTWVFGDWRTNPTDMYYGCLDGDWNADHDAFWAEAADSAEAEPGDLTDLLPELLVGRLPVNGRQDCTVQLQKSRDYINCVGGAYQNRFLMMGEVLFPLDYPDNPNISIDGAAYCESIYVNHTGPAQHVVRLYENYLPFPGAEPLTLNAAEDSLRNGWGLVLHNGHGARQTMSVGDGSLDNYVVSHLDNGHRTFLLYMVNCTAGAFDFNSISETFLSNPHGGAHAVLGSTRETFANISAHYMEIFFDRLYRDDSLRLGHLYASMMNGLVSQTSEDNGYRWAHTTIALMGDPSIWHHYEASGVPVVSHPDQLILGSGPLSITVNPLSPRADILVTMRKGNEDYIRAYTDLDGQVQFDLHPETAGLYKFKTSSRDAAPATGIIRLELPQSTPQPALSAVIVNDLDTDLVSGNGNGIAEQGEQFFLDLTVTNHGDALTSNLTGVLRSEHPGVIRYDSIANFANLLPGAQGRDSLFTILLTLEDDEIIPFQLELSCDQGVFMEDFFLETATSELVLHRTDIIDVMGGDGDGVLEVGESCQLEISLGNRGRGLGTGILAFLSAAAGSGVEVVTGEYFLGDLEPLGLNLGPAYFQVTRVSADPPDLQLLLMDVRGYVDTLLLNLDRPTSPLPAPEFTLGGDASRLLLTWEPPTEDPPAAYLILRGAEPTGPFTEISEHWVINSSFEDRGLIPYTSYWYRVQSLSAGGLTGEISPAAVVTTSLAQKRGWPVEVNKEMAGTPVVGDFDADGENEIMVGSNLVCGFNTNGSELFDGDGDPVTKGPISGLGDSFFNSLAAADLDQQGGLELVGCSWNTGEVYIWTFEDTPTGAVASLLDGWPRSIDYSYGIWATPALGDIDGDGDREILVVDIGGSLMAWHHDGSEVIDGDGDPGTQGVFATDLGGWTRSSTALADLDLDGDDEVIVGSRAGYLYAFDGDGSPVSGFPVRLNGNSETFASPSVGDIDGDGLLEIIFPAENDSLYAVNHDGTNVSGWPIHLRNDNWALAPSCALADLDGDGAAEIFSCSIRTYDDMEVAWFDGQGNTLPGWPRAASFSSQSSPVVADLDDDGDFEVVLGNEFAHVEAWHHDGEPVAGFPLVTGDYVRATPTIMDVDRDGLLDIILPGWDKNVYIWELPVPQGGEKTPWYTFAHDQLRTGNHDRLDWVIEVSEETPIWPDGVDLHRNFPNPFNPTTRIRFTVGGKAPTAVSLSIHDVRGRLIRQLVSETLNPGSHLRTWDGRDGGGRGVASGVYLARLQVAGQVESRKMTLLK